MYMVYRSGLQGVLFHVAAALLSLAGDSPYAIA
jgi:hypothetical protein